MKEILQKLLHCILQLTYRIYIVLDTNILSTNDIYTQFPIISVYSFYIVFYIKINNFSNFRFFLPVFVPAAWMIKYVFHFLPSEFRGSY